MARSKVITLQSDAFLILKNIFVFRYWLAYCSIRNCKNKLSIIIDVDAKVNLMMIKCFQHRFN